MFHGKGRALILGAAMLMLGACTGRSHMVATATDTNLALEQSTNEMLLLNIIRASQQKPMYFTGLTGITMGVTAKAAGSLAVPFGQAATHSYTFSPSFSFEARPGFQVQVLDDKEFMNGIHTPATLDTLGFYMASGWPKEFVYYLMIESVVVNGKTLRNIAFSEAVDKERHGANARIKINRKLI